MAPNAAFAQGLVQPPETTRTLEISRHARRKGSASHGYEIIKAIENKYGRAPGPAVVYPTLQLLVDQGYVNSSEHETRRCNALTDEGKKCLEENRERIDQLFTSVGQPSGTHFLNRQTRCSLAGTIFSNCTYLDDAKTKQIEDLLDETRKRVGDIIFENQAD